MNPSFGNNPRWLWEAVELYDADPNASRQIYEVGYLRGDVASVLGPTPAEFEQAWRAYVRERYPPLS